MTVMRTSLLIFHRYSTLSTGGHLSRTYRDASKFKKIVAAVPYKNMATSSSTSAQSSASEDDTIFEVVNGKGVITLNRPQALNALNLSMAKKIYQNLREWESSNVEFVIIKGSGGKAFCAGGDIRAVTDSAKAKDGSTLYNDFFREEYHVNNLIGTLRIPYVALIDGITMGGGVGLSVHGLFRVATERTLFAMPETAIGLFPDVGGSYFLPRLGGKLGIYLALTGYRLKGGDVFRSGVATHMCSSDMLSSLEQDLLSLKSSKQQEIDAVLQKYHSQCPDARKTFSLQDKMDTINKTFDAETVEGILQNLRNNGTEWALKTVENLSKMSPTSMKISLKLLQMGAELELQECLRIEYRLSQRCCEGHDFVEGVRALLVDKDQNPKWNPSTLEGVTPEIVEKFFSPLPAERELNL